MTETLEGGLKGLTYTSYSWWCPCGHGYSQGAGVGQECECGRIWSWAEIEQVAKAMTYEFTSDRDATTSTIYFLNPDYPDLGRWMGLFREESARQRRAASKT
jgi:hypothetical protein